MEAGKHMEGLHKIHERQRYFRLRENIEEKLKRRADKGLSEKKFQSMVSVSTAEVFREASKAEKDPLTGLLKKHAFEERLEREIARAKRNKSTVNVIVIDLDGFKALNDTFGHIAGDEALRIVAKALTTSVRTYDLVSRPGGDEFLLGEPNGNIESAKRIAERLKGKLDDASRTNNSLKLLSASFGVVEYDGNSDVSVEELLERADTAMYNAKLQPGMSVIQWQPGMTIPKEATMKR